MYGVDSPYRLHLPLMEKEIAYFGRHACEAIFKYRPTQIGRAYFLKDAGYEELATQVKNKNIQVKFVGEQDLEKLSGSLHHQGICFFAQEKRILEFSDWIKNFKPAEAQLLLYLDGVGNPHNLGAIVRTAAHLGVKTIIGEKGNLPRLTAAASRTAEGGAEHVQLVRISKKSYAELEKLRELGFGFTAAGIVPGKAQSLFDYSFPQKSLLILGAEQEGLSPDILELQPNLVTIPGTDKVQSLNVSVSAAIFCAEYFRQNQ